jgi:hypothetical protein
MMADILDKDLVGIVGSIFATSPEAMKIARERADLTRAQAIANAEAQQMGGGSALSANLMGGQAVRQLGGLLGVEDPMMQRESAKRQLATGLDMSSPEAVMEYANRLANAGLQQEAAQAITAARAMQQQMANLGKTRAEEQAKLREQVKPIGLTTDGKQVYQSGANQFVLTEQGPQPYYGTLESKTPKTTINMAGENEVSKVIGKGIGEAQLKVAESGEAAAENLIKINETLNELKTSEAFTGFASDLQSNIAKVQAKFADDKKAGKRVTDTEYLDALLGSDVFPMISSLGIGARGLDTPAEREFLRKVMTGTVGLERDTLIRLTETRKNIAERAVKKYNAKVESGELNKYFQLKGVEPRKIEIPTAPPTPAQGQQAPVYARNPSTNQRIVSTDGGKTWNPVGGQ